MNDERLMQLHQAYEIVRDLNKICVGYAKSSRKLNDKLYGELFNRLIKESFSWHIRQCIIEKLERLTEEGEEIAWNAQQKLHSGGK